MYYKCGFNRPAGMNNDTKNCSQCNKKENCSQLYEKLGQSKGPNIAWKVIVAFLVPILVFILSLAAANQLFESKFEGKMLTVAAFLAASVVTLLVIVLIRAIRRPSK